MEMMFEDDTAYDTRHLPGQFFHEEAYGPNGIVFISRNLRVSGICMHAFAEIRSNKRLVVACAGRSCGSLNLHTSILRRDVIVWWMYELQGTLRDNCR